MYMEKIAKDKKELETLIHADRIYRQDIEMKFGIEKSIMLVMKSGKRHLTDGMELANQDKIKTLGEKETYKYLSILEADTITQMKMKDKIQKEYTYQESMEEEDLPVLKTVLTHRYNNSGTT